jgi:acyl-coenzyme A thioesterase PaaI-like protein
VTAFADLLTHAKQTGHIGSLVDSIPYLKFLNIGIELVDGGLVGKMTYSKHLIGNSSLPALHGGTIGALLESTAIVHTLWEAETSAMPKIVTITIDYLRSGKPVDTYARGVITKHGRRVVNVGVEAWQDDRARPIARANAHFLVEPIA